MKPADSPGEETIQSPPALPASQQPQAVNATQMYLTDTKSQQSGLQNESSPPPLVISSSAVCLPSGSFRLDTDAAMLSNFWLNDLLISTTDCFTVVESTMIDFCYTSLTYLFGEFEPSSYSRSGDRAHCICLLK